MPLYFITENKDLLNQRIKIGISNNPAQRLKNLQTGNFRRLALMGWVNSNNNRKLEKEFHQKYSALNITGEWFEINHEIVLELLFFKKNRLFYRV